MCATKGANNLDKYWDNEEYVISVVVAVLILLQVISTNQDSA